MPQSSLVCPEEGAGERSQGQRRPPAEDPEEGAAAASVSLHRLYGLDQRRSDETRPDSTVGYEVSFFCFFFFFSLGIHEVSP